MDALGDKVVILLDAHGKPPPQPTRLYLGRPQNIYFNNTCDARAYVWLSRDNEFGTLPSPRQQFEELWDMYKIRPDKTSVRHQEALLSPRHDVKTSQPDWLPDGPNTSNPCRRLPITLGTDQSLEVTLGNLRYDPVRVLTYHIEHDEFVERWKASEKGNEMEEEQRRKKKRHSWFSTFSKRGRRNRRHTVGSGETADEAWTTTMFFPQFHNTTQLKRVLSKHLWMRFQFQYHPVSKQIDIYQMRLDVFHARDSMTFYQQPQLALTGRK